MFCDVLPPLLLLVRVLRRHDAVRQVLDLHALGHVQPKPLAHCALHVVQQLEPGREKGKGARGLHLM